MNEWTLIAQATALAVLIRMVCFLNLMKIGQVPQRCILGVLAAGVGAAGVMLAPWLEGVEFSWPTALFAAAAAVFVWTDRRGPTRG